MLACWKSGPRRRREAVPGGAGVHLPQALTRQTAHRPSSPRTRPRTDPQPPRPTPAAGFTPGGASDRRRRGPTSPRRLRRRKEPRGLSRRLLASPPYPLHSEVSSTAPTSGISPWRPPRAAGKTGDPGQESTFLRVPPEAVWRPWTRQLASLDHS